MTLNVKITKNQFIEEWQKDLRSGNYNQGEGRLCSLEEDYSKYCCLGIACLTGQRLGIEGSQWSEDTQLHASAYPGDWFLDLLGSTDPIVEYYDIGEQEAEEESLSGLNDNHRFSFDDIADALDSIKD